MKNFLDRIAQRVTHPPLGHTRARHAIHVARGDAVGQGHAYGRFDPRFCMVRIAVATCLCLSAACSSDETGNGADDGAIATSGPFLPWTVGNRWTYQVTGDGETSTKETTIESEELIGGSGPNAGETALRVVTKKGAVDQTVSWQALEGERVVRYREQAFHATSGELELEEHWDPSKLHFDHSAAHTAAQASWLEEYTETKQEADEPPATETQRDVWTVDAVDQVVTVPAGTFRAIVVQKAGGSNLKTYWYVAGVGKVKETGGQTEELVDYMVSP